MPNAKAVAQYLPFLRRYARALTGNQASGDGNIDARGLELLTGARSIVGQNIRELMGRAKTVRVGRLAKGLDLLQLLPAELVNVFV